MIIPIFGLIVILYHYKCLAKSDFYEILCGMLGGY